MTFVYGSIEPETYVSYLCFMSYTPLRPTEIRKNGEKRRKTKNGKIRISGLARRMTFADGSIEPEIYVSYLCFISYTPLRPTKIRKNGKNVEKRQNP